MSDIPFVVDSLNWVLLNANRVLRDLKIMYRFQWIGSQVAIWIIQGDVLVKLGIVFGVSYFQWVLVQ